MRCTFTDLQDSVIDLLRDARHWQYGFPQDWELPDLPQDLQTKVEYVHVKLRQLIAALEDLNLRVTSD